MNKDNVFQAWLQDRKIEDVEAFVLGEEFVTLYTVLKDEEYWEFQEIITPYEREILMFNF